MRRFLVTALLAVLAAAPAPVHATPPVPATDVRLVLPEPTGPYRIGTVSVHLVDRSRADPWVPSEPARELMVQFWYPARDVRAYPRAPWVSPAVAARLNPPGSGLVLPVTHGHVGAPARPGRHPVVVYSPGLGLERTSGTALVEDLASHGYVVVTIDHTHDAGLVEFPDGRVAELAIPQPPDPAEFEKVVARALAVRVADTRFTLDRLRAMARGRPSLPRGLAGSLDLGRVGMFGASLGGATAAEVMAEDRRVRAGVNLDGSIAGRVLDAGLDRPFLQFGSEPTDDGPDETWEAFWERLRGPRRELALTGAAHLSFTDLHTLVQQGGLPPAQVAELFGPIDGERSIAVQRAYVGAFFDRHLRHRAGGLLRGPSPRFREVVFVR
ncbi:alpha/beta hydrolase family protein [Jidongwangia harbinensis]|uniref:alpha/beta hydrolase family protein n=1 Tax=Jidongwangia harbinensis TaxID=2878561 RepID=UPI001CD97550|nr:hydrolase [Jidongwangia harbinensis]MCA2214060.1 hydrolase [Jidongwangia harbinensis]